MTRVARSAGETRSRVPDPAPRRGDAGAALIDRTPRGERMQALAQLVRAATTPVVQRDGENSPGLNQAIKDAKKYAKGGTKDEILEGLAKKGLQRLIDLDGGGERKEAEKEEEAPADLTLIEKHPLGRVVHTIKKPVKQPKHLDIEVSTSVFNRGIAAGPDGVEKLEAPAKEGLKIASCTNTFHVTRPMFGKGDILGMTALDNFITRDPTENIEGLRVFMNQAVEAQYALLIEAKQASAPKAKEAAGGLRLPFSITRTPAIGTELAQALTAPKCEPDSKGDWTTNRELAALGSEHGTIAYRLCLDRGLGKKNLTITFESGNPTYTLHA